MEAKPRRGRRLSFTPEQIAVVLGKYERGERSARELAAEHGIGLSTLWGWRRRHRPRVKVTRRPRWIELKSESLSAVPGEVAHVRLPDGLILQLCRGFEVEPIAQLLQLLRRR